MAEDNVVTQALLEEFKSRREEDRPPCTRLFDDEDEVLGFARFAVERATEGLSRILAGLDEAIAADPCLQLVVGPRVLSGSEVAVKASWNRGRSSLSVRAATALAGIAAVLAGRDQENGGVS